MLLRWCHQSSCFCVELYLHCFVCELHNGYSLAVNFCFPALKVLWESCSSVSKQGCCSWLSTLAGTPSQLLTVDNCLYVLHLTVRCFSRSGCKNPGVRLLKDLVLIAHGCQLAFQIAAAHSVPLWQLRFPSYLCAVPSVPKRFKHRLRWRKKAGRSSVMYLRQACQTVGKKWKAV